MTAPDQLDLTDDSAHFVYATITSNLPEAVHDAALKFVADVLRGMRCPTIIDADCALRLALAKYSNTKGRLR